MRNVAIILAGGSGKRMGAEVPKQFLELRGIPVIVHTIKNFQMHSEIDEILVVCLKNWISYMSDIVARFNLNKVKWIIEGGDTVHDSTRNALFHLKESLVEVDYVVIHDAARPILPQIAITNMLSTAYTFGNASLAIPSHETLIYTEDQISGISQLDRNCVMRVQTPQAYRYSDILELYERAERDGIHDIVYADLVAIHYSYRVYFSKGFVNNIKITCKEDIALCDSLMDFSEEDLYS